MAEEQLAVSSVPTAKENRPVVIRVKNLYKIYRVGDIKVRALDGLDFDIYKGEFVAIVGASGSGKSTLLNMLAGLEKPTKGEIEIGRVHIEKMTERQLVSFRREKVGFIFQAYNLLNTMNALENVALPLSFRGVSRRQRLKEARKYMDLVGVGGQARHMPNQMSGGQQQRVGIARAFVAKPKVIFADEPTGNLDSTTSRQVLYSMLEMAKSYGITFVMVTHEKELAYCGDRIVTIKDGRVLDNVLLGEDEKAENRRRLFGDVTSGDIAEPETTVAEEKKPAARQAKAVAAAVAEKVNQESM